MENIILYKDDYETPITINVKTQGNIIPLIGSKVFFDFVDKKRNEKIGGGECEIIQNQQGLAQYKFKDRELTVCGNYQGTFTIDLAQGARRKSLAYNFKIIEGINNGRSNIESRKMPNRSNASQPVESC